MPALWEPHGVGPREDELFRGRSHEIINRNRFDPAALRERGPWNSVPHVVIDGKKVPAADAPKQQVTPSVPRPPVVRRFADTRTLAGLQSDLNSMRQQLDAKRAG